MKFAHAASLLLALGSTACSDHPKGGRAESLSPGAMRPIATIDERFQSYNVEMIEVTGGRFWKPYKEIAALLQARDSAKRSPETSRAVPVGMDPGLYQQRPPIDLTNARLRKLAGALGTTYVRVSGTWANTTYFHDSDLPAPKAPPKGFNGVLTRQEWKGVIEFANAANARLVTSFATSPGTRNAAGVWNPVQAGRLLAYTKSIGGAIAAAEYMNEPTYAAMGGAPAGYDAAAYGRDIRVFVPFMKKNSPDTILLGPGGVGEGISLAPIGLAGAQLSSEDLLNATGPVFDGVSYHSYGATSQRCASMGPASQTTAAAALSDEVLSRADRIEEFYAGLRNKFEPGKPLWLTETADAACGGNPWASTFLDSFRYLDQLGRLAKRGLSVHMHNTLASSDYGLLDSDTFMPRPNYWAALLWKNFMGATVLDPGPSTVPAVHLYAHCLKDKPGEVAVLAINTDKGASHDVNFTAASERYTLTGQTLEATSIQLNGNELKLTADDALPALNGVSTPSGPISFGPASITFLTFVNANNNTCR
jgi:heparanase 1